MLFAVFFIVVVRNNVASDLFHENTEGHLIVYSFHTRCEKHPNVLVEYF